MTPSRHLQRVERAAAKVRRAEDGLAAARAELRAAVAAARESGEPLTAIARTLGVTRQRVRQLLSA